jgi:predicted enzyme related to lactoylglutathione lyase
VGARTSYAPGTFCWVDVGTPDLPAATTFYAGLFGWDVEAVDPSEPGAYAMARLEGAEVAGLWAHGPEETAAGLPSAWHSYVSVPDADATLARAAELGGTPVPPGAFDVEGRGRGGVLQDPAGVVLGLWQPGTDPGAGRVNEPGCLTWNDLLHPDPAAVAPFYRDLLGWEVEDVGGGAYWSVRTAAGATNGGMLRWEGGPPAWVPYFAVGDLEAAGARTLELGGQVLAGPREVPAGAFLALRDPQGAVFNAFAGELDP